MGGEGRGGCFGGENQKKKVISDVLMIHHSELGRFLCTKTGEDQKNKVFTQKWNSFCVRTHFKSNVKSDIFCMPMPMGEGVTLAFSANISLKSDKNVVCSILCMPVKGRL